MCENDADYYTKEENYQTEFNKNLKLCIDTFKNLFDDSLKLTCVCAPGRVNLIGEHTDYNDGFVFPMAIPLYTIIVGAYNGDSENICRIKTLEPSLSPYDYIECDINELKPSPHPYKWSNYVKGTILYFKGKKQSFNAVIKSNVPIGGGLSSSASLQVATYTLLESLSGEFSDLKEKAATCLVAEQEFVKLPCGIMDQYISIMAKKDHALLIDCRSLENKLYPLLDEKVSIVITNSNVKHELEESDYPDRRKTCDLAASIFNKKSLRDVSFEELYEKKDSIDEIVFKCARHVVTELQRTIDAAKALELNDMNKFGKLMNESHFSLRDDFNVSCAELDKLVEIALNTNGVYGSRLTGGGFGGCTVTLVKTENVNNFINNIKNLYPGKATFYVCRPCDGTYQILDTK